MRVSKACGPLAQRKEAGRVRVEIGLAAAAALESGSESHRSRSGLIRAETWAQSAPAASLGGHFRPVRRGLRVLPSLVYSSGSVRIRLACTGLG
jgi:hypothetical protein